MQRTLIPRALDQIAQVKTPMKQSAIPEMMRQIAKKYAIDLDTIKHVVVTDRVQYLLPDSGCVKIKNRYLVYITVRKERGPVTKWLREHNIITHWQNPTPGRRKPNIPDIKITADEHEEIRDTVRKNLAYFADAQMKDLPGQRNRGPRDRTKGLLLDYARIKLQNPDRTTNWIAHEMDIGKYNLHTMINRWEAYIPWEEAKKSVDRAGILSYTK